VTAPRKPLTAEQKAKAAARLRAYRATPEGKAKTAAWNRARPPVTSERKANKVESNRVYYLMLKYGLTDEQYDLILSAQGGRCAICQCVPRTRRLAVDHCHKTAKTADKLKSVRGLLCSRCNNRLLGAAHDKPEILDRAADYLRHPPAPTALLAEEGQAA
jgi:hypothetical protein